MKTNNATRQIKCSSCGAPVNYKPGMLSVYCEYCNSTSVIIPEDKEKQTTLNKEIFDLKEGEIIKCPSCLAEYQKEECIPIANCIFCEGEINQENVYNGFFVDPSHLIPFSKNETEFKEKLDDYLIKYNFPSIVHSPEKFSDLIFNRCYMPAWTDDINIYNDDKELANPAFYYRNLFCIDSRYLVYGCDKYNFLPFYRNKLIPKNENALENTKVLLYAFNANISDNSVEMIRYRREISLKEQSLSVASYKDYSKIRKYSLVLLPINECRFTYQNTTYCIYQNAQTGKIVSKKLEPVISSGCVTLFFILLWA